ncbi:MAG: hypothetical protein IJ326_12170 [Lachnospiraceae bacterium]|nr:hypothetical protein [Lachnospiraceae bacterium]
MKEKLFVICDSDEEYLAGLQNYLEKKKLADFHFKSFSSLELAQEYNRENVFEILLLNEQLYEESVENMQVNKLFFLTEEGGRRMTEDNSVIMKYQSAEKLLSSVLDGYAKDECCKSGMPCVTQRTRLITFYSPDVQANQTLAALAAGQILSEKKKVLYLNLKPFSGLQDMLECHYTSDLSDFIYFALKHSDRLVYKLGAMKQSVEGLDYMPPFANPKDIMQLSEEQWEQIVDALMEFGNYEEIVIEVSDACQGLFKLLNRSDKIYTLYGESKLSVAGIAEYRHFYGKEAFIQRTSFITEPQEWRQKEYDYRSLALGHPGQYMKGILYEDGIM